jgi:hypothetical protein
MLRARLYSILIAVTLLPFVTGCTLWSQPKNSSWKNATGAEQYERLLWQAVKEKDWLSVESHIASNFVFMDANGTRDKQQRVRELHELQFADLSLGDVNVTSHGADAVVTYSLTFNGANVAGSTHRFMSVWQQQKRGWVLVAMTEIVPSR